VTTDQTLIIGLAALAGLLLLVLLVLLGYLLGSRARQRQLAEALKEQAAPFTPATGVVASGDAVAPVLADMSSRLHALQTAVAAEEARRGQEDNIWETIRRVEGTLATLNQLSANQQQVQENVNAALRDLNAIKTAQIEERQRWSQEDTAYASLKRLTAVMVGSASAGKAGERLVGDALTNLDPKLLTIDHKVNGKPVEFAVRLPDGKILPIDSKIIAQSDLDRLDQAADADGRGKLERAIQAEVLTRVREVQQYIDERAPGFAAAVITDAAYAVAGPTLSRAYMEYHVLVVPYSLLLPFVFLVVEQHRKSPLRLDDARQVEALERIGQNLEHATQELNGRMSTAITQLNNGRGELLRSIEDARVEVQWLRNIALDSADTP
jgi:DNA recombination protein RmuC